MLIGIVGAPNKGKSLFFSTLTAIEVGVADYPFTTIEPNRGVALLRLPCVHVELGLSKCNARGGHCKEGMREIAVPLMDVAGLVPGASSGKGMGNQFLDDLRTADGFIQVIDASGRTDLEGKLTTDFVIEREVDFLDTELVEWLGSVVARNFPKFKNRGMTELAEALSGLGYSPAALAGAAARAGLSVERIEWSEEDIKRFAKTLWAGGKPLVVAANKADLPKAEERAEELAIKRPNMVIVPCSAAYEHALQKAVKKGLISYPAGSKEFVVVGALEEPQRVGLEQMALFMKKHQGTGVYQTLHQMVFGRLGMKVVYPVEDENHYTDRSGVVLPDALLVPGGTTAIELAERIHTDLAKKFICAVDARTKRRLGREHVLNNNDIVKIVCAR